MIVLITGDRGWDDGRLIDRFLETLNIDDVIVAGGARGADTMVRIRAETKGMTTITVPARWHIHKRAAGPIRNREMAFYGDALVLLWDGKSRGSKNMRKHAVAEEIQLFEHILPEQGAD